MEEEEKKKGKDYKKTSILGNIDWTANPDKAVGEQACFSASQRKHDFRRPHEKFRNAVRNAIRQSLEILR